MEFRLAAISCFPKAVYDKDATFFPLVWPLGAMGSISRTSNMTVRRLLVANQKPIVLSTGLNGNLAPLVRHLAPLDGHLAPLDGHLAPLDGPLGALHEKWGLWMALAYSG